MRESSTGHLPNDQRFACGPGALCRPPGGDLARTLPTAGCGGQPQGPTGATACYAAAGTSPRRDAVAALQRSPRTLDPGPARAVAVDVATGVRTVRPRMIPPSLQGHARPTARSDGDQRHERRAHERPRWSAARCGMLLLPWRPTRPLPTACPLAVDTKTTAAEKTITLPVSITFHLHLRAISTKPTRPGPPPHQFTKARAGRPAHGPPSARCC